MEFNNENKTKNDNLNDNDSIIDNENNSNTLNHGTQQTMNDTNANVKESIKNNKQYYVNQNESQKQNERKQTPIPQIDLSTTKRKKEGTMKKILKHMFAGLANSNNKQQMQQVLYHSVCVCVCVCFLLFFLNQRDVKST